MPGGSAVGVAPWARSQGRPLPSNGGERVPGSTSFIRGGDVLHLTRSASVQFVRPIVVRVIREMIDRHCYDGWTWIEAYELNARGEAVAKRELFVQPTGLRWLAATHSGSTQQPQQTRVKVSVPT